MGEQPEGVAKVVEEGPGPILVEHALGRLKQLLTADSRPHRALDHFQRVDDRLPRFQLIVGRLPINGDRATVVGEIATVGRPEIQDK